jgi:hypothetical protein
MKNPRSLLAAFLAVSLLTVTAFAADISGNWKWTSVTKTGPANITANFVLTDGALTGIVTGRQGPAAIGDATFKDGVVAFTVTRGTPEAKVVFKYSGKFDGDTITGTIEKPGPKKDDPPVKMEWNATRVAAK